MAYFDMRENTISVVVAKCIDDIRYSKQRQWNMVYGTLLAIAGVISLSVAKEDLCKYLLAIVLLLVSILGIGFVGIFHCSMRSYQIKKEAIMDQFSQQTRYIERKERTCCCGFFKKDFFPPVLF